jgi:hypothetical protein
MEYTFPSAGFELATLMAIGTDCTVVIGKMAT